MTKKIFNVYHTKSWALNSLLHFDKGEVYKPFKEDYELVAGVVCEAVGETFHLTNHIDYEWWENEGVVKVKESRSTSVGDVVHDTVTGELWLCCSIGWAKVEWNTGLKSDDPWWKENLERYQELYAQIQLA